MTIKNCSYIFLSYIDIVLFIALPLENYFSDVQHSIHHVIPMLVKNNQHLVNPIYGLYTFLSCITNKMNQCKNLRE